MRGVDLMRNLSRFALIVAIGGAAGACSSDVARFSGSPFSNPFKSRAGGEPTMTGSVPPKSAAAPNARVEAQPLAPPTASAAPVYNRPPAPAPMAPPMAAAKPATPSRPVASGPAGWTAQGGTPVTVRSGDNLNLIATRYGVPASAILEANGLKNAAQVSPGRQIVIPIYNAGGVAAAHVPQRQAGEAKLRFVQGPKGQDPKAQKLGSAKDRVRQAGAKANEAKTDPKLAKAQPKAEPAKQAAKAEPAKHAKTEKVAAAQPIKPAAAAPKAAEAPKPAQIEIAKAPAKEPEQTASIAPQATAYAPSPAAAAGLGFRWPAKGRVIAGFGGAGGNEGINIALPEGTPVKAAEDGTVAYAGSDVKGYGKLVLIRHDNGYVSAYAHNGEINVKHGEKVKRGQPIAKSGQTGNVTSPQLHFEIRKGASPVDPMPHLQGG
jgi:murein DD-endopeptidase MepM/ murein hydrolase activator NlpD